MDQEHIEWLSDYLCSLDHAFMVVSHDYTFLEKISNRICDIDNQKITKYYGTYSEFLKKKLPYGKIIFVSILRNRGK